MKTSLLKSTTLFIAGLFFAGALQALEVGDQAPCVVLDHTQQGVESTHCIRDPQVEGRPVFIEFFSITCSDCIKNIPRIRELAQALEGRATVRLVSVDRDENKVRQFIQANNIELEVAFDSQRDARRAYGVSVTPTLFLLNQENQVVDKHTGVLSAQDVLDLIEKSESL